MQVVLPVDFKPAPRIPVIGLRNQRYHPMPIKAELEYLYRQQMLSSRVLARFYQVSSTTIRRWLRFYNLPAWNKTETNRRTWANPECRQARTQSLRRVGLDPTHREKISSAQKQHYSNPEARQKLSKSLCGVRRSPEAKANISRAARNRTPQHQARINAAWQDPEKRARRIANIALAMQRRPTAPEQRLIEIIKGYNLPFRYTGDGSFIIAGLNPDFVNINGAKVALEVFGDHWHKELADSGNRLHVTEESRRAKLAEYGWSLVVLWESELKKMPDAEVVNRIISDPQNKGKEVICSKVY